MTPFLLLNSIQNRCRKPGPKCSYEHKLSQKAFTIPKMLSFWAVCFFITEKVEVLSTLRWTVELHECFSYVLMAKCLLFVTYYNVQVFLSLTNGCQLNDFYMQHPSNLDPHLIKLHPLSVVNKFCLMNSNYWTTRSAS